MLKTPESGAIYKVTFTVKNEQGAVLDELVHFFYTMAEFLEPLGTMSTTCPTANQVNQLLDDAPKGAVIHSFDDQLERTTSTVFVEKLLFQSA